MNNNADRYFGLSKRIFPWKEVSEQETALGDVAERDSGEGRRLYAEYYRDLNPEYYEKGKLSARKLYDEIAEDFGEISFEEAYIDMVYCLHRYGFSFNDYCVFRLFTVNEEGRKRFISDKLRYHYYDILNDSYVIEKMKNKLDCYRHYKEFYHRDVVGIKPDEDVKEFEEFVKKHDRFIYKPLKDHSGHGIRIFTRGEIGDSAEWYREMAVSHPGVAEQLLIQSPELSRLNPSSVNTCRCVTVNTGDSVEILAVTLRMGINGSVTDNAGSGGIYACVDPETGIVISTAMDYKSNQYIFHPSTGMVIPGFRLPYWDEAKRMLKSLATKHTGTNIISWDLASVKSKRGMWSLVEANGCGIMDLNQSNLKIGLKKRLYALMDRYFAAKESETKK